MLYVYAISFPFSQSDTTGATKSSKVCLLLCGASQSAHQLNRQGKDDGRILLGRDVGQGLKVSQLQGRRGPAQNLSGISQGSRCFLLSLGSNDLKVFGIEVPTE